MKLITESQEKSYKKILDVFQEMDEAKNKENPFYLILKEVAEHIKGCSGTQKRFYGNSAGIIITTPLFDDLYGLDIYYEGIENQNILFCDIITMPPQSSRIKLCHAHLNAEEVILFLEVINDYTHRFQNMLISKSSKSLRNEK